VVVDSGPESDPEADSDLRRRAAWLLAMLAAVAVLFVIVMSQLGTADKPSHGNGPRALDSVVGQPSASISAHSTHSSTSSGSHTSPGSSPTGASPVETTTCPTQQACILQGDPGHGIAAINAYRTQHGRSPVAGRVSKKAQQCALNNGSGCSGGWAETQLGQLEGPAAVQKILPFAHLLDSFKAVQVGWAFDPRGHQYYFAIIRTD